MKDRTVMYETKHNWNRSLPASSGGASKTTEIDLCASGGDRAQERPDKR